MRRWHLRFIRPSLHEWRKGIRLGAAISGVMLAITLPALAASGLEAKVQAAYLYNFTKFIDWPSLPEDSFTICVVGAEAVGESLNDLSGRLVKGLPLKIAQGPPDDPGRCQILYLSGSPARISEWLQRVQGGSVLTVSDASNFARQGGVIGFYSEGGKVKLEINPGRVHDAHLKISAKLMEIGRILP